jgi:outer membrane cobalamin receptor
MVIRSYGQTALKIFGQVIDRSGPVTDAVVKVDNTVFKDVTDQSGYYHIFDVPPGNYRVSCHLNGIQVTTGDYVVVGDGPALRRDIYFEKNIINIAPVYIEAVPQAKVSESGFEVKVYYVRRKGVDEIEELLHDIPGLNLIISPATSEIFISAGGIRPEGVNVLVDGRKINSLLTGRADLSQIPLNAINSIEYYSPGLTSNASEGGLGGTINIVTVGNRDMDFLQVSCSKGDYDLENYTAGLDFIRPDLGDLKMTWENGYSRNDYKYTDVFSRPGIRENAHCRYKKYYISYSKILLGNYFSISGFGYSGHSGVPGQTITPSREAKSKKETISVGGELTRQLNSINRLGLLLSYLKRITDYNDTSMFVPYDNRYIEKEASFVFKGDLSVSRKLSINFKACFTSGFLEGIDYIRPFSSLGKKWREVYKLYGGARYQHDMGKASFSMGISQAWDFIDDKKHPSMSATATATCNDLTLSFLNFTIGSTLSYAKTFRLPGLAELHWKEDVFVIANPNLNPEKSRSVSSEIFSRYQLFGKWCLSIEYRDIRYKDLIYWRRSQGIKYKPVNVSFSDYFGTTVSVSYKSPAEFIEIDFSRVKSAALNREEGQPYYGKYITFQPLYTNHLAISFNYRGFYAKSSIFDSSHRYFLEENTKKLNAYTLIDFKIGYSVILKKVTTNLEFKIDNATDAEYELLEYQPMPPRSYSFGLTIKI